MSKRITYNVTIERKEKLEQLAVSASVKAGRTITWSELVVYLIDNYAIDAASRLATGKNNNKQNDKNII